MKYKRGEILFCKKDLVMSDTGITEYTKGKRYRIQSIRYGDEYYNVIDNSKDNHHLSDDDLDTFFSTRYLKLKRVLKYDMD